jgi:nucleoside-diphosphate-sugar epimerase
MDENDFKGKRVAIIGGAGFIGHHLALHLNNLGAEVNVIDSLQVNNLFSLIANQAKNEFSPLYLNMTTQRLQLLKNVNIPLSVVDARDYHALSEVLGKIKPHTIIHLAAIAHAGQSNKDPYSTFDHSLRTLENALDYARGNVEHFIYFSSSMVYGNFNNKAVTEDTYCEPLGIDGALKFAGEKMVIAYNQVFDLPYTIIRPSALYGERCISRRIGQILIENALNGLEITISGDGSERLDFTYIKDLVHGVERVMKSPNSRGEIFNITYGSSRSVQQMLEILYKEFPDIKVKYTDRDRLMPNRGTLSVDKAKSLIGYNPSHPLEKGYVDYITWYRANHSNTQIVEVPEINSLKIKDNIPENFINR